MGANWGYYNSPNAWPYTNFHELNLDWILQKTKALETSTTTIQQAIDSTNERIDQTNKNVSNLSKQNLATLEVAERGRALHNYFDNSDFTNPVNQRGATTYNSAGYCIDRWLLASGSASINASGITLTGATFGQRVALKAGIYTFEFNLTTGTTLFINIQYDGASSVTQIGGEATTTGAYITATNYSPGIVVFQFVQEENDVHTASWAALYAGSYTASDGPDYVTKGYAVELVECQRYYRRYINSAPAISISATSIEAEMPLEPPMRVIPTININSVGSAYTPEGMKSVSVSYPATNTVNKAGYVFYTQSIGIGLPCIVNGIDGDLSADL